MREGDSVTTNHELDVLLDAGGFFEGPRWRDGRWWVSDFQRHGVFSVTTDGSEEQHLAADGQTSGIGWLPDDSMLVVAMDGQLLRRTADGTVEVYADLSSQAHSHLNDMVVSATGHAYIGQFGFDIDAGAKPELAELLHVAPDRSVSVAADGLFFPNGSVITPDGSTLLVGELGGRYTAFTIADDGQLTDRRVWAEMATMPVLGDLGETMAQLKASPDGCSLDAEGAIWVADPINHRLARIIEGGEVVDEIAAPKDLYFWACKHGGEDGRTLLLCTAPGFLDHGNGEGKLLTTRVDVPGAGLP